MDRKYGEERGGRQVEGGWLTADESARSSFLIIRVNVNNPMKINDMT
jgi:hypothetical protein